MMSTGSITPFVPLKFIAEIVSGGTPKADSDNWNGDIPFITPPDLNGLDGDVVSRWERTLTKDGTSGSSITNDAVLLSCRAPIGHVGVVTSEVAFNQGCKSIVPQDADDLAYVAYCLVASRRALQALGRGTTFMELSTTELSNFSIPWPVFEDRCTIVRYLDRETGEIDAMRAKLNELESTLLKRRRAVILEATCQGGPEEGKSATPSSFEVSKHEWQIVPLKFAVDSAQTGVWGQEANGGSDDLPCVRVADFDRLRNRVTEAPTIRRIEYKDRVRCELQKGDLLVEKSGGTGKNPVGAVVAFIGDFPAVCSNFIIRLRCRENQYPRFWLYALHGSYIAGRTWNYVRQTTGIQNLDVNGFMSMSHPAPDFDEQRRIAEHLDEVTSRIDAMLAKIDELKALLVERRAALITDVVTGRKKVPA